MASEEFVEEFDSDDDEQFVQQTPIFATYNPLYIPERITPNYHFHCPPPSPPPPRYPFAPWEPVSCQGHTVSSPTKQSKKRRQRREKVKLTEYNESIKSHAWKTCQLFSLQKSLNIIKLDKGESAEEQRKIVEKMEAIKTDLNSSDATTFSSSDLRKLVNKFKSQRAKREREKSQRKVKSDEKSSNKVKAEEIDKWQKEQTTIHDKQRQHELFVQNSKKSLAQKLREVRRKKLINVQSGFASKAESIARSSREFETGICASKRKLEFALQRVVKDEEKILFTMKESEQELSELLVHKTTQSESGVANLEIWRKMKRDRKWKKYLYKKMCNY